VSAGWQRVHPLARLALLGLAVLAAFAAIALTGPLSGARVRGWLGGGSGLRAAVVFVALYAGLTAACFPGPVLAGVSGLLFGTLEGTVLALGGAVLGAVLAFTLSRSVAGDLVARVGGPRLRRLSAWVGRRGFRSVLYARIIPGAPYSVVNYAAGLTPVGLRDFALATAVGAAPRTFAYTALGGSLHDLTSPAALVAFGLILAMAVLGLGLGVREHGRPGAGRHAGPGGRAGSEQRGHADDPAGVAAEVDHRDAGDTAEHEAVDGGEDGGPEPGSTGAAVAGQGLERRVGGAAADGPAPGGEDVDHQGLGAAVGLDQEGVPGQGGETAEVRSLRDRPAVGEGGADTGGLALLLALGGELERVDQALGGSGGEGL
jgi:uncharacterized membrane protein YdjX (TVP38/TMEM64 family)